MINAFACEANFTGTDAAGRFDQPDNGGSGERFTRAGFAYDPKHLARHDVEGDAVDRDQCAAPGGKLDPQIAHAEKSFRHRSFGLSASRIQSPSRLTASTRPASVIPGKIAIHHSPANRNLLPMLIRVPSDGS